MVETTDKVIVVGASTGGTEAIKVFLEKMPADAPGSIEALFRILRHRGVTQVLLDCDQHAFQQAVTEV